MFEIDDPIKYKPMDYYIGKIREAITPLDILVNADFLTDLLDKELKEKNNKKIKLNEKKRSEKLWKIIVKKKKNY